MKVWKKSLEKFSNRIITHIAFSQCHCDVTFFLLCYWISLKWSESFEKLCAVFFLLYIDIEKKKKLVWFVERFVLVFWFYFMVFIQKYFSFSWQLCLCWVRIYCEHFNVLCFVNDIFSGVKSLNRILPFVTGTNKCGIVFIYLLIFVWYDEPKCIQFTSWLFVKLQTHNKNYRGLHYIGTFLQNCGRFHGRERKKP